MRTYLPRHVPRCLVILCLLAAPALAQRTEPPDAPRPIQLTLDLGLVDAAGNTRLTTFNFGDQLEFRAPAVSVTQVATVVYGRTADSTTAEQLKAGVHGEYQVASRVAAFAGVSLERNRFAGIRLRLQQSAGLAVRMMDRAADQWSLEAGASLNQQRGTATASGTFVALRLATRYRHQFTPGAYVAQAAELEPNVQDVEDVLIHSESTIVGQLSGRIAVKLTYGVRFDNRPEPGFQKSDRLFSSALQIAF